MAKISLGCGISALRNVIAMSPAVITATQPLAMSGLYDGQAVDDAADYAAMVSPSNFVSAAGTIVSAAVSFTGDAISASGPLSEGDTAGFSVLVTDSEGNEKTFVASPVTVAFKVQITATKDNEAQVLINDLVPDAEVIPLTITGGPYDGTYNIMADDLRASPYNVAGTVAITGTAGETLAAADGLWFYKTADITLTRQWQSNGMDIPGQTGATFDSSTVPGTDVTVEVTGNDGEHIPITAESAAISIPATPGLSVLSVRDGTDTTAGSGAISDFIPAGAAAADKEVWLVVSYGQSVSPTPPTITIGGATPTPVVEQLSNQNTSLGIYRIAAPAGGDLALSFDVANQFSCATWRAYTVEGRTTEAVGSAYHATYGAMDLSADVTDGQFIIGVAAMGNNGTTGTLGAVGLTAGPEYTDLHANKSQLFYDEVLSSTETPRTITLTPTGNGNSAVAAAIAILG